MFFSDDNNYEGYHRPMYNLMHTFDFVVWGENALGFHLSSLFIHMANVILLFFIASNFSGKQATAVYIALFFGLLPCHTATVSLIHSKADLLACLFVLVPIFLYSKTDFRRGPPPRALVLIVWCFFFLLALLSKEVAIMLPFFIGSVALLLSRYDRKFPASLYICPSVLVVAFIVFRLSATGSSSKGDFLALADRLLTFIPVYVEYIFLTFSSYELTTNDAVLIWSHFGASAYALYVIAFIGLLAGQFYFAKKSTFIAVGFLWFNLFLVPVAQLIPILHFRADRFLYLPSLGFVWAMAFIFHYYHKKYSWQKYRKVIEWVLWALLLYASIRIWQRNRDFVSDEVMFQKLVLTHPECREAQGFVGSWYLKKGNYDTALIHISKALEKQEKYYSFVDEKANAGNLAVVYIYQNQIEEARDVLLELKSGKNYDPEVAFNLGICYKKLRDFEASRVSLEEYLISKPNNIHALFNLGAIGMELGDRDMARMYFQRYLQLNPTSEYRADIQDILESM